MIPEWLNQLHFIRPLWLLAILPATLLVWLLLQRKAGQSGWRNAINSSLLAHLSDGFSGSSNRAPYYGLWLALCAASLALAGPSWQKLPQPIHQRQDALVIVLDQSLSMLAEDIQPSRLVRARHKVLDILKLRREGVTGLVAYSGDAHVVTPLTDDTPTIANLVPSLSPLIMPVTGSDPVAGLQLASSLFTSAGVNRGRVLLITDGITAENIDGIGNLLSDNNLELSILGVGTEEGAPIPADKGYLRDDNGNIIVPRLNRVLLEKLAANNSGRYIDSALDDRDIKFLLPPSLQGMDQQTLVSDRQFDQWLDRGPWLTLLLIPAVALAFRRGWLLTLALPLLLTPRSGFAYEWQDLWQTPNQRAQSQLNQGDAASAASTFEDPAWKGSAYYRAKEYSQAAQQFSNLDTPAAHFNRGNALARAGELQQALDAYDKALEQDPGMEDALFNKQLVEDLLKQQQQQNQQQQDQQQNQQQDQQQSSENQSGQQQDQQQGQQHNQQQQGQQQQGQQQQSADSSQSRQQSSGQQQPQQSSQADASRENDSIQQSQQAQNNREDNEAENSRQSQPVQQSDESGNDQQQQNVQALQPQQQDADSQDSRQQMAMDSATEQKRQATEQWLRRIPDDPAGLLRRKFNYESQVRQQQQKSNGEQPQW